jgi:alanine dehydrogenase
VTSPLWIGAGEVAALVTMPEMIAALRDGFRRGAVMAPRQRHEIEPADGASLLVMAAWAPGVGRVVKLMSAVPANRARGLPTSAEIVSLFDPVTGALLAAIDSAALTSLRTAAASALAADHLARPDARRLAVFATGPLAPWMAEAHAAVRNYDRVTVWGRDAARAAATAGAIARRLPGVQVVSTTDAASAAADADVITTATRATVPVLRGAWLCPGAHVDLVGGYKPDMRESDDATVAGASIWLDLRSAALDGAGDIQQPLAAGVIAASDICGDLADLVRLDGPARRMPTERTVFKSVGCALEDLYAARLVYDRMAVRRSGGVA